MHIYGRPLWVAIEAAKVPWKYTLSSYEYKFLRIFFDEHNDVNFVVEVISSVAKHLFYRMSIGLPHDFARFHTAPILRKLSHPRSLYTFFMPLPHELIHCRPRLPLYLGKWAFGAKPSVRRCLRGVQQVIRINGPQANKCSAKLSQRGDPTPRLELAWDVESKFHEARYVQISVWLVTFD